MMVVEVVLIDSLMAKMYKLTKFNASGGPVCLLKYYDSIKVELIQNYEPDLPFMDTYLDLCPRIIASDVVPSSLSPGFF